MSTANPGEHGKPAKGLKGGECNRTACNRSPANSFNKSTRAFYCRPCAERINGINGEVVCIIDGGPIL